MDYDPLAKLYELQYGDYYDDISFYAKQAEQLGGKVLELGAGSGRVTIPLARRGIDITALELSPEMLRHGKEKAQGLPIRWIQGDMRQLDMAEQFEVIIAPFNALMHLYTVADQTRAFRGIKAHLKPQGSFLFDVYIPNFGLEGVLRHEGETFYGKDYRQDVFVLQNINRLKQFADTQYFIDTTRADGTLTREHARLTQRYFQRYELEWMLQAFGFTAKFYGSFQLEPLTEKSHHMIVVAQL